MKLGWKRLAVVLLLFAQLQFFLTAARSQHSRSANPLAAMEWLVGDWSIEAKTNQKVYGQVHYRRALGGNGISFEYVSPSGQQTKSGMFRYDPSTASIVYTASGVSGEPALGHAFLGPDAVLLEYNLSTRSGEQVHLRARLTRIDANLYENIEGDDPTSLVYRRVIKKPS